MTILIVTITDVMAVVTQDTAVWRPLRGVGYPPASLVCPKDDYDKMFRESFIGDGRPPTHSPIGFAQKMTHLPKLAMLVAPVGSWRFASLWAHTLQDDPPGCDADHVDEVAEQRLRAIAERFPPDGPTAIFHVGWAPRRERIVGYCYSSSEGFRSRSIGGPGHCGMVLPDTT